MKFDLFVLAALQSQLNLLSLPPSQSVGFVVLEAFMATQVPDANDIPPCYIHQLSSAKLAYLCHVVFPSQECSLRDAVRNAGPGARQSFSVFPQY